MFASIRNATLLSTALLCMAPNSSARGPKAIQSRVVTQYPRRSVGPGLDIGLRLGKARVQIGFGSRKAVRCCSHQAGYYRTVSERVWVQGAPIQVWVPARYEWRPDSCGSVIQVLVQAGYYRTEFGPGHYAMRSRRIWMPARTVCSRGIHIH